MKNIPLERTIVDKIKKYLMSLPSCYVIKTHGSRFGSGQPDLIGCCQGRTLALEVKRPGGKPTTLQLKTLDKWRDAGAIAGVVYGVEDVKDLMANG